MRITIKPERVLFILLIITAILAVVHVISGIIILNIDPESHLRYVLGAFDMDQEISLPTWFSQMVLAIAGFVALMIGLMRRAGKKTYFRHWIAISIILIFMSADEGASLHELAAVPIGNALNTEGTLFYFAWVIAGMAVVLAVAAIFLRFWWKLPKRTRILVFISALVYVSGAIGAEMLGGYWMSNYGMDIVYRALAVIEESLELVGASLAVYTFLDFARDNEERSNIDIIR